MKSKVDIILPTYNGEKYIKELIDSILNQSYQEFVIIIRDDSSKDNTIEILCEYQQKFPNKVKVIEDTLGNLGVVNNTFELLKYAKGDYILFCDQDDVWFKNKIEKLLIFIKQKEAGRSDAPILVHSDVVVVDKDLNIINKSFMRYSRLNWRRNSLCNLIQKNVVQGASIIINRALLARAQVLMENKTNKTDKFVYHDLWFALLASIFGELYFLQKPLMYYRQHGNNLVGAKAVKNNIHKMINLTKEEIHTFRYSNYLTVNRQLCIELIRLYRNELSKRQLEIILHFKERPSDMNEFFSLKLYQNYNLREVIMMILLGVINI